MAEEDRNLTTSLFPLFPTPDAASASASTTVSSAPQWLSNSSFTADLSLINESVSAQYKIQPLDDDDEEEDDEADDGGGRSESKYELVESDGESDDGERSRKRKKRRKKGRKEDEMSNSFAVRKPSGQSWLKSGSVAKGSGSVKDYVFDSHGDRDNLAFGSLYRY